ncbi:MAG: hypothetical protein AAF192_14375 [Pseudomonadota bacterium]
MGGDIFEIYWVYAEGKRACAVGPCFVGFDPFDLDGMQVQAAPFILLWVALRARSLRAQRAAARAAGD